MNYARLFLRINFVSFCFSFSSPNVYSRNLGSTTAMMEFCNIIKAFVEVVVFEDCSRLYRFEDCDANNTLILVVYSPI